MSTVFIYALKCPTTEEIRYVGKTNNVSNRIRQHVSDGQKETNKKAQWIRSLLSHGRKPIFELLDEVPEIEWPQWEVAYIEYFRESGHGLLNVCAGGNGFPEHTAETRAKIGAARRGKPLSFEHRQKLRETKLGKKRSLQSCLNQSASTKGVPKPAGFGIKISTAHKGKKVSLEARAKMRESRLRWLSNNQPQKKNNYVS